MKLKITLLLFILIANQNIGQAQNQETFASSITAEELKEKLYTYASDEFEGRETGTKGQKIAIEYLKNSYTNLGIAAAKADGDYFQNVPLVLVETPKVSINIDETSFEYYQDFISITDAKSSVINASDIVVVGYGIKDALYNDYKDMDVTNKIVVAIAGEPKNEDGTYLMSGTDEISKWSNGRQAMRSKQNTAKELGAKAFFLINDAMFKRYANYYQARDERGGESNLALDVNEEPMYGFLVSEAMGAVLLKTNTIEIDFKQVSEPIISENVAAMIKGSEKPDEYIILSAHLDHVGMHDGEVFNGADDDGSGTVAILEIAEAFKAAQEKGQGPKRSVIFLHVTGEEKGLLGSQYYTDYDPIVPLAQTVSNLNIDMIGRTDPKRTEGKRNYIYLIGSDKLSTDLHNLSEEMNTKYTNIELDYTYNDENDPNRFYYRSDHYNFAKNNIPIIFYFNGTHADYHKATDTPDKIEYDLLENRTRLVFHTAWELANREDAVRVDKAVE
ncbi:peptidase, M28 family [Formosa sp. Hel1_33_131]|uniref:M28 family peptidase n=1 Tax=Formosa sp. Hel1_33_131 TaxID=1336794 RepID=UPI00084E107F|nr:M28 family peptidase [Formosa sp. Hel1_33_131]AOR27172.1 peptidase, M28 family [Formosa sp. Hel1_33_131]